MVARSARLREQLALADSLRDDDRTWTDIATPCAPATGSNARVAMRLAHGWTQAEAAQQWNRRWPDDPKTFKNISYWENWPSPTGHMPSLHVLDRLAQIYDCNVADLLAAGASTAATGAPTAAPSRRRWRGKWLTSTCTSSPAPSRTGRASSPAISAAHCCSS